MLLILIFKYYLNFYKNELCKIKSDFIDKIDEIKSKINCSKFYYDMEYKLTENEFNFTVLLYYSIHTACEVGEREKLGYVLKMLLHILTFKMPIYKIVICYL